MTTENKNTDKNEETKSKSTKKSKSSSSSKSTRGSSVSKVTTKTKSTKADPASGTKKSSKSSSVSKVTTKTVKATATTKTKSTKADPASGTKKTSKGSSSVSKKKAEAPQKKVLVNKLALIQKHFQTTVSETLIEEFKYSSKMQVPRINKIVLNIGLGEALTNSRALENAVRDLSLISGQKPVATKAKKSIATYKLREGQIIGVMVTLRKRRMYEFLERLIISALPRIRDFHGIPAGSFDGRGNYSLGVREQIIFPEIEYGSVDKMRGLMISIVTSANTNQESKRLLELLGMPFEREDASRKIA